MQVLDRFAVVGTPGTLRPLYSDRPVLKGPGDDTYVCGSCRIVLMAGVTLQRAREFGIVCGGCGSLNAVVKPAELET